MHQTLAFYNLNMKPHYIRKAVPLEVRGLSRDHIEISHPRPEHVDDYFSDGTYQFSAAGELPYSIGQTSYSGHGSPDRGQSDITHSMLSVSIGGGTGNTTERSSICSLGDDDFEREATHEVELMFQEIDSCLFEGKSGPRQLVGECSEWGSTFPHLRILGEQIVAPQDEGYELIEGNSTPRTNNVLMDVTEHDISLAHTMHELSILGQPVQAYQAPLEKLSSRLPHGKVEEEIIEQDGNVEDIIAIDYKTYEEDVHSLHTNHNRQKPRGLPPVTPHACVKDNITSAAFDYMWSETISWLRHMLKQYAENVVLDQDDILKQQQEVMPSDVFAFSTTRDSHYSHEREWSTFNERKGSSPPDGLNKLDGVLTISIKALQSRDKSMLGEMSDQAYDRSSSNQHRPMSSVRLDVHRPVSVRLHEQPRLSSARLIKNRGRLAPIDRAKTPNADDDRNPRLSNEGVRGRGISTINEQQISPPPFSRNGALPPIGLDLDLQSGIIPKKRSQRASSAVHNETRFHIGERQRTVLGVPHENRPSTTVALYRSETPLGLGGRRSSTPLGFSRLSHNMPAVPAPSLNITGNSINPHIDSSLDVEDSIHQNYDDLTSQRWGSSSLHPQIRRAKQQHSIVR